MSDGIIKFLRQAFLMTIAHAHVRNRRIQGNEKLTLQVKRTIHAVLYRDEKLSRWKLHLSDFKVNFQKGLVCKDVRITFVQI